MAIDIRATVTCSLGTLISGSISDDYIQGSGLVKTKGSVEISGTITPAIGTVVTFSYVKGGVTRSIPRKLRVMSSFADPFRRTTKVELGCKLTYLSDLQEPVDWSAFDDPENAGFTEADARIVTLPIYASSAMDKCLTELGITASSNPLTNKFSVATFDFGGGYVQVLNDLLVSESYCGYLDTSEVLQVFALDQDAGTGPVFTASDIVDLGPIGVGNLPGEAVTVSYSTLKLKAPDPDANANTLSWELEEIIGAPSSIFIQYQLGDDPEQRTSEFKYIPRTTVVTEYDAWDRVTKRTTTTYTIGATLNSQYYKDAASVGNEYFGYIWASSEQQIIEIELTKYTKEATAGSVQSRPDDYSEVLSTFRQKYEPKMATLGAAGISTLVVLESGSTNLDFVSGSAVTEIVEVFSETGSKTVALNSQLGTVPVTKSITKKQLAYGNTQQGQQDIAERSNATEGQNYSGLLSQALILVDDGTETVINTGREVSLESRPSSADLTNAAYSKDGDPNNGWRTDSKASLELAVGSATAQRRIELSMPYAPDDTFSGPSGGGPFTATASDAPAKANRYGRVQNRLLLGNRNGINLQLAPEKLPAAPYSPLYVQASGLTALYRANGTSWAFDSNGIVCSVDALFWAAVGGTGTFWFPVAPGITTLPTTPAIVDGTMTPTTTVLPYNETAIYVGLLRTRLDVTKFDYNLTLLTALPFTLQIDTQAFRVQLFPADSTSFTATGEDAALVRGYQLISDATSFVTTGFSAGCISDNGIGTNPGTFTYTGEDSVLFYQRNPMPADVGVFTLSGQDTGFTQSKTMAADVGSFTLSGQNANLVKTSVATGAAGTFTLSGQTAGLSVGGQVQSALLLYTGNASTLSVTGAGFRPGLVLLKQRNGTSTHGWFDKVRGATTYLRGSTAASEVTNATTLTAFDSDGFTLGSNATFNTNAATYVAHCLKEGGAVASNTNGTVTTSVSVNTDFEWSAFTYTGVGNATNTVGHGLSGVPDLVIIKARTSTFSHWVGSPLLGTPKAYDFRTTSITTTNAVFQAFGATTLTVDSNVMSAGTNYSGWAVKIKAGVNDVALFTGNGSTTYTQTIGWQPRFILMKNTTTTTGSWFVFYRAAGGTGYANFIDTRTTDAEAVSTTVQITSTGFSVDVGGPGNVSGGTTQALYWAVK